MTPNIVRRGSKQKDAGSGTLSVIESLEHKFKPISTFFVVPIFAFANTGVVITSESIKGAAQSSVAWGIFFGLVVGKPLGILISAISSKRLKLADFPEGANNSAILATGSAAGIGFTVAIFIANLAFDDKQTQEIAVLAVIVASVVSALVSIAFFKVLSSKQASQ
jgi:NhaA family Na+:H+ antiporter